MRTFALASLLLASGVLGFAQEATETVDKAPPEIEEALRARVNQYYGAFVAGKFKEAYLLVADDSQNAFFESSKDQYKACETIKIRYLPTFTRATVLESCKTDWKWHGIVTPTTFPLTSTWKIEDGKWVWTYVRPTQVANPFSPTGFVNVPPAEATAKDASLPKDVQSMAQTILAKVSVDRQIVHLHSDESSQDIIHVHNAMPGVIKLQMDQLAVPGLKITLGKTVLGANEDTTVSFDYRLDDPGISCIDCAKKIQGTPVVSLRVTPTGQVFPISVAFAPAPPVQSHKQPVPVPQK
jgi:hypothetical protein